MSREWKPGDVVTATVKGRESVRLVAGWSKYEPQLRWCEMSPRWGDGDDDECWFMPHDVTDHRRLVAIDPEDRGAVERLAGLIDAAEDKDDNFNINADEWALNAMQAALREYANPTPPKPDEPQGLGAVVEDENGIRYSRIGRKSGCWLRDDGGLSGYVWDEIAAARVLSPGVEVDQ